jgi:hypothetical protein
MLFQLCGQNVGQRWVGIEFYQFLLNPWYNFLLNKLLRHKALKDHGKKPIT